MQTPDEIRRDLLPDLDAGERDSLVAAAMRLQAERLTPTPNLRGDLRRALVGTPREQRTEEMGRGTLPALAVAYVAAGTLLLAIAALGLAGSGPLSPT